MKGVSILGRQNVGLIGNGNTVTINSRARATSGKSATPENLLLPIEAPRDSWPTLLNHAADALTGRCIYDSETLALELRAIAVALRVEVSA